jgi:SNF2 family DNA or RNA helicase
VIGRAYRLGQRNPVSVYRLIVDCDIEKAQVQHALKKVGTVSIY